MFMSLSVAVARVKASSGWTPLHLASYFGHRDAVEELLKVGDDVALYIMSSAYLQSVKFT